MSEPLSFICWKWAPAAGRKSVFTARHVNTLARMIARHYRKPHRVICVTDDARGIDQAIGIIPLWRDLADLPNPHGPSYPSCYRRLRMFSTEAEEMFGERFVSLDLDCVIVGDLIPLVDRPGDIWLWGKTNPTTHYNGSMIMMQAGARSRVWTDFDPASSPAMARRGKQFGSDQGWISHKLGPGEKTWGKADGIYSYRYDIRSGDGQLPKNARIVFFNGRSSDPSDPEANRRQWVRENWC